MNAIAHVGAAHGEIGAALVLAGHDRVRRHRLAFAYRDPLHGIRRSGKDLVARLGDFAAAPADIALATPDLAGVNAVAHVGAAHGEFGAALVPAGDHRRARYIAAADRHP